MGRAAGGREESSCVHYSRDAAPRQQGPHRAAIQVAGAFGAPARETDGRWLRQRLPAIKDKCGSGELTVCADRGFDSAATAACLAQQKVVNAVCPRNPQELARRCAEDPGLVGLLRRRGGNEARIAIVKNVFLDGIPRAKGFERRQLQVAWAVLTHNLWVVARLSQASRAKEKLLAA